jgi:hypothetical protein
MAMLMKFEIRDPEWAQGLQFGLEEYMGTLYNSLEADSDSEEADPDTESGIPFCGCNVCEGREILSFIAPRVIKGYLDKKIGYVEVDEADHKGKIIEVPLNMKHD